MQYAVQQQIYPLRTILCVVLLFVARMDFNDDKLLLFLNE